MKASGGTSEDLWVKVGEGEEGRLLDLLVKGKVVSKTCIFKIFLYKFVFVIHV